MLKWGLGLNPASAILRSRTLPEQLTWIVLVHTSRAVLSSTQDGMGKVLTSAVFLFVALGVCASQAEAASVFGRAVKSDGSTAAGPCRATLRAEVNRRGAPDSD